MPGPGTTPGLTAPSSGAGAHAGVLSGAHITIARAIPSFIPGATLTGILSTVPGDPGPFIPTVPTIPMVRILTAPDHIITVPYMWLLLATMQPPLPEDATGCHAEASTRT